MLRYESTAVARRVAEYPPVSACFVDGPPLPAVGPLENRIGHRSGWSMTGAKVMATSVASYVTFIRATQNEHARMQRKHTAKGFEEEEEGPSGLKAAPYNGMCKPLEWTCHGHLTPCAPHDP